MREEALISAGHAGAPQATSGGGGSSYSQGGASAAPVSAPPSVTFTYVVVASPAPLPAPPPAGNSGGGSPGPAPDTTAPDTTITKAKISGRKRTAKFTFASNEAGSSFLCKLDKKSFRACTSPKTYRHLKPGKHTFSVKARDPAGNTDFLPAVQKFKIRR